MSDAVVSAVIDVDPVVVDANGVALDVLPASASSVGAPPPTPSAAREDGLRLRPSAASSSSTPLPSASAPLFPSESSSSSSGEWGSSPGRDAAMSIAAFLSPEEQARMVQLPAEFKGMSKLVMPAYIQGPISNVTLPSRLDLLGRRGFKVLGGLASRRVGNTVLGWAPVLSHGWTSKEWKVTSQLFVMPWLFSKSMARIVLFLRCVAVALAVIFLLDVTGAADANPGRVWVFGIFLALVVMYKQSSYRRAPDGVMAFCRSMGVPEVEEYMFSYCWKVEPENVRTLAKAVWKAGVGVWIDVVKLCPGDEIRPMVRTTVRRVHKVVVFLCEEYCNSPNCCVEMLEAMQYPSKVTVCIIKNNLPEGILYFLEQQKALGLRVCTGFDELMAILDLDLQDQTDLSAYEWWKRQHISGAGVPSNLVPSNWPMGRFSLRGRWVLPEKSLDVGPVYLSGDCKTTGPALAVPWLFFVALLGVGINVYDMADKYLHSSFLHNTIDYVFLGVIALCNCAPFIGISYLIDCRRDCHVALRPILASRSMGAEGIKVRVVGWADDPVVQGLRGFLASIGHLAPDAPDVVKQPDAPSPLARAGKEQRCVTVYVMESLAARDALFGPTAPKSAFDNRYSLFIWSGAKEVAGVIPFTDDQTGQRLMRYLVLVRDWEKHGLAESLFSAIGVRVVDILHEKSAMHGGSSLLLNSPQQRLSEPASPER